MKRFRLRGFTSILLSTAFLVVFITGLVLWLANSPQTLGIGKSVWKHIHIYVSLLMAAAVVLHFVLNWSVYWGYLWQRASRRLNQKLELVLALALVAAVASTALLDDRGSALQRMGAMSLQEIAENTGQPLDRVVAALNEEGIHIHDPANSLNEIAEQNKVCLHALRAIVGRAMRPGNTTPTH